MITSTLVDAKLSDPLERHRQNLPRLDNTAVLLNMKRVANQVPIHFESCL